MSLASTGDCINSTVAVQPRVFTWSAKATDTGFPGTNGTVQPWADDVLSTALIRIRRIEAWMATVDPGTTGNLVSFWGALVQGAVPVPIFDLEFVIPGTAPVGSNLDPVGPVTLPAAQVVTPATQNNYSGPTAVVAHATFDKCLVVPWDTYIEWWANASGTIGDVIGLQIHWEVVGS